MNHICILEVNHFPGLAFNNSKKSNPDLIRKWFEKNESFLSKCIDFYIPHLVIIGGKSTLTNMIVDFCENQNYRDSHFFNWTRVTKVSECTKDHQYSILGRKILPESDYRKVLNSGTLNTETQTASIFKDEKGCIWFPWHHPANPSFNTYWDENSRNRIASFIKDFLINTSTFKGSNQNRQ